MNARALKEIKRVRFSTDHSSLTHRIDCKRLQNKRKEEKNNWDYFGSNNPENIYLKPDSSKTLGRQLPFVLHCSAGSKGVSVHSKSLKKYLKG